MRRWRLHEIRMNNCNEKKTQTSSIAPRAWAQSFYVGVIWNVKYCSHVRMSEEGIFLLFYPIMCTARHKSFAYDKRAAFIKIQLFWFVFLLFIQSLLKTHYWGLFLQMSPVLKGSFQNGKLMALYSFNIFLIRCLELLFYYVFCKKK